MQTLKALSQLLMLQRIFGVNWISCLHDFARKQALDGIKSTRFARQNRTSTHLLPVGRVPHAV